VDFHAFKRRAFAPSPQGPKFKDAWKRTGGGREEFTTLPFDRKLWRSSEGEGEKGRGLMNKTKRMYEEQGGNTGEED
jgi:hypothetical protein